MTALHAFLLRTWRVPALLAVILGGLLTSPFLTLFSTPVVYLLIEGLRARLARLRAARPEPAAG